MTVPGFMTFFVVVVKQLQGSLSEPIFPMSVFLLETKRVRHTERERERLINGWMDTDI